MNEQEAIIFNKVINFFKLKLSKYFQDYAMKIEERGIVFVKHSSNFHFFVFAIFEKVQS